MSVTDTSEGGLEDLIERDLLARGWLKGQSSDYRRDTCADPSTKQ